MNEVYILDACALIAVLKKENGFEKVTAVYKKANSSEAEIIMNKANLLEVYYGFYKDKGKEYADKIIDGINKSIINITEISDPVFFEAGRIKASYRISFADAIVLAEASASGGVLLTADHHEFDALEKSENIQFLWIR